MKVKSITKFLTGGLLALSLALACASPKEKDSTHIDKKETFVNETTVDLESPGMKAHQMAELEENYIWKISDRNATVYYAGEEFSKSVFSAGGDKLCIVGLKPDLTYFWGSMNCEEEYFQEADIGLQENLRAFNMVVDTHSRCHVLCMSVENTVIDGEPLSRITFEKSYIVIIGRNCEIENVIDVSDIFAKEKNRPFCFVVDHDGNYYFENGKKIICIPNDLSSSSTVVCDGIIEGIGIGKSGHLYCTYIDEDHGRKLGYLESGEIVYRADLPDVKAAYVNISAGTDTDVFMYNKAGGVYAYDFDNNAIELRIPSEELPISGQDVCGYGFMGDGRLCLMTQQEKTIFYYIPVGK